MSGLDKPVAIHPRNHVRKIHSQEIYPMNKIARITTSALALLVLLCLTSKAMAGESITEAKVNQITRGVTSEEDLVRAFGPPTTKTDCPPGQVTLDWFYVSPISAQNYIPILVRLSAEQM